MPTTVFLKMGTVVKGVHLNRVRPLLEPDNRGQPVPGDWTPPLFHDGECPPSSGEVDPDDSASSDDGASPATYSSEETASPTEVPPDPQQQLADGPSPEDSTAIRTTHSGQVVKPMHRFGWT